MLSDPAEIKQVFTAAPDVLHPGAGARVLEPVVGRESVILLDGRAHMEQRKLMLPAFHGERMERLSALMTEVTEREVASWPRERPVQLHPRMQRLTLEIILRAVFGLAPGGRLDALRERLGAMLAFGDRAISLMPPPADGRAAWALERIGPFAQFVALQQQADALIFELIAERRRHPGDADDVLAMLLDARHDDETPMSDQELHDELMTLLVAGHETTASGLAWAFEGLPRPPEVMARLIDELQAGDGDAYLTATIQEALRRRPVLPNVAPRLVVAPIEVGGWSYPLGVCLIPNAYLVHHDPAIYPDPVRVRTRAVPRAGSGDLHLDPVRRRQAALPRGALRDARDEAGPKGGPERVRAARHDCRLRGRAAAQHHDPTGRRGARRTRGSPAPSGCGVMSSGRPMFARSPGTWWILTL